MDTIAVALRRERAITALVPLFFVSGATGLTYQTIWGRELHLVFGTSTFAIATVLSAFMAGLALGGAVMGARADTLRRPLFTYGVLEIVIGVYAVLFPVLVRLLEPIYLAFWRSGEPSPVVYGLVQYLLVGSALLLPTAMMGATLPLLARFATERLQAAGDRVGLLYGVNTAGAVFGTWVCGFVLLPGLGLTTTTWLAAVSNVVLGVGAIGLGRWAAANDDGDELADLDVLEDPTPDEPAPNVHAGTVWLGPVLVSSAFAGFASMVYEVAWFRVLGLMLGASVYAFSVMLLAFLVGIAVGGRAGGPWADRLWARGGPGAVLRALAWVELGVGASSYGMMYAYQELPFWYVWLFDLLGAASSPTWMWITSLVIAGLVMTPPALLMGAAFPLAVRAVMGGVDDVGGAVGRIYASNTAGGVLGAALAGFVLLPWLAVKGTVVLAIAVNVAAAAAAWLGQGAQARSSLGLPTGRAALGATGVLGLTLVVAPPGWDPLLMTAGMYKYVTSFEDHSREGIYDYAVGQYDLLYYAEGLSSVVTVARNQGSGNIWLANNGKVDASTTVDMPTQVMVSLLPMQFVEDPEDVLVIGLASGITAGAVTLVDDVERLDVVELEPAIVEAARFFDDYNHHLLDDPRTELFLNDGRNHVLLTEPGTYDVIVSEPSNPWLTGVSNLFTAEFFAMGKARLKPGGVWAQWVQLYGMDDRDLKSLLGTFADTYDHVLLYAAAEDADLVLVGSDEPLQPTVEWAARLWTWPRVAEELETIDYSTPTDVIASLLMDRAHILDLTEGVPRNTDDNMRIEYEAPLNLHRDTQSMNIPMLYSNTWTPLDALQATPEQVAALARRYRDLDDPDRALDAITWAALAAEPDTPLRAALLDEGFRWYVEERTGAEALEAVGKAQLGVLEREYLQSRVQPLLEAQRDDAE